MLQQLRTAQTNLDTKPGSVARDLFVDGQALQISTVYDSIRQVAALQSMGLNNFTYSMLTEALHGELGFRAYDSKRC